MQVSMQNVTSSS